MQRKFVWVAVAGAAVLVVGAVFAAPLFLPESSTNLNEDLGSDNDETAVVLKQGEFSGKTGHHVAGTVRLVTTSEGAFLEFIDYEQTAGPDVFVYLTPDSDPDTRAEIDAGVRILIDGGADGGESTKTGTFSQRLPPGLDLDAFAGVAIWCDRFSVPFGAAPLN